MKNTGGAVRVSLFGGEPFFCWIPMMVLFEFEFLGKVWRRD